MGKKADLADVFGSHTDSFALNVKEVPAWKKEGSYTDSFALNVKEVPAWKKEGSYTDSFAFGSKEVPAWKNDGSYTDSFAFGSKEGPAWKNDGQYTDSFALNKEKRSLQAVFEAPEVKQEYDPKANPVIDNIDLTICSDEERPRMVALINRLAKSEAGKETLEIAVKAGYRFGFLDASSGDAGTCFGTLHAIGLNPVVPDDKLISTLCHESRHAGQKDRMKYIPDRDLLDVASGVRRARAEEADAQAYAVVACKQLEMKGDKVPLAAFAESKTGMATYGF